ncbi:MAG: hypothetical protein M3Z37_05975 [Candidatus Eremiobacteraeota bacterium]|nr:hypothetical protein [Candidatus Eremiobacteraeota bacterium]
MLTTRPWTRALALCAAVSCIGVGMSRANADAVTIVAGTPLKVHIMGELSSATATPGQTFQIEAAEPLTVQGAIVISQGAPGQGHVVAATPARKSGKGGRLSVQLDWINAVDGQQLQLSATPRAESGTNKIGTANTANAVAALVFGPVGLFAHNFVKGKDVVVRADFVFPGYDASDRTVNVINRY